MAIIATATASFAYLLQTPERFIYPPVECGPPADIALPLIGQSHPGKRRSRPNTGQQPGYVRSNTRSPSENSSRTSGSASEVDNSFSIRRTR